jgi:hypothetical protein
MMLYPSELKFGQKEALILSGSSLRCVVLSVAFMGLFAGLEATGPSGFIIHWIISFSVCTGFCCAND